jgi:alpha-1,2-mannosyltransferase
MAACAAAAIAIALTVALLATAVAGYVRTGNGIGGDFLANYTGGALVRREAGRLYDLDAQALTQIDASPAGEEEDLLPFVLPPFAALAFAPVSLLPYQTALTAFGALNLILLGTLALLLRRELRSLEPRPRAAFLAGALGSIPFVVTLSWGQIDFVVAIGLLLGWRLLRARRDLAAGAALSLALVKPQLLLGVVALLIWQRRWRPLAALGGIAFVAGAGPMVILGPGATFDYAALILGITGMPATMDVRPEVMANWRGLTTSIVGRDSVALWAPGALVVGTLAAAAAAKAWREDAGAPRAYAFAVMLPLLISPHLHMASLVLLFTGLAIAAGSAPGIALALPGRRALGADLLALWLVPVLFTGWFLTANGLAVMVFVSAGVFAWYALTPAEIAPAQAVEPRALAA